MTAHMSGDERAHWAALDELRDEARKSAEAQARGQKPPIPHRSRTFTRRAGRRR